MSPFIIVTSTCTLPLVKGEGLYVALPLLGGHGSLSHAPLKEGHGSSSHVSPG